MSVGVSKSTQYTRKSQKYRNDNYPINRIKYRCTNLPNNASFVNNLSKPNLKFSYTASNTVRNIFNKKNKKRAKAGIYIYCTKYPMMYIVETSRNQNKTPM